MDIEMPVLDGLSALREIMHKRPTPVVMLSSRTRRGAKETIESLALGAVDFVCKPSGPISFDIDGVKDALFSKMRLAAQARMTPVTITPGLAPKTMSASAKYYQGVNALASQVVTIGCSTGGPRALEVIVTKLPNDLSACVLVAQHMPEGFTKAMAERLDAISAIEVREARTEDAIEIGTVLIAPGGKHMVAASRTQVQVTEGEPLWGVRPAADMLMRSAARAFGKDCCGIVLTGMGRDGADGLREIREAGGATIAQSETSCVVYGMPKAAIEAGVVQSVLPLDTIAEEITRKVMRKPGNGYA